MTRQRPPTPAAFCALAAAAFLICGCGSPARTPVEPEPATAEPATPAPGPAAELAVAWAALADGVGSAADCSAAAASVDGWTAAHSQRMKELEIEIQDAIMAQPEASREAFASAAAGGIQPHQATFGAAVQRCAADPTFQSAMVRMDQALGPPELKAYPVEAGQGAGQGPPG